VQVDVYGSPKNINKVKPLQGVEKIDPIPGRHSVVPKKSEPLNEVPDSNSAEKEVVQDDPF